MQKVIIFPLVTGQKKRLITTYANNEVGVKLKQKHQEVLTTFDYSIFNYDVTFAYLPQQNAKQLVHKHLQNKYFYQFDVKDFFLTIDLNILKNLATKYQTIDLSNVINECAFSREKGLGIGLLPSPFLSNLYLLEFDKQMEAYAKSHNLIYTRYADDLTFSSKTNFNQEILTTKLQSELSSLKLQLNLNKSHYKHLTHIGDSVKILGLNLVNGRDNPYITVSRKFKKLAQLENNHLRKIGMDNYIHYNQK